DQRQIVLLQKRTEAVVRLHSFNLIAEKLDPVKSKSGNVADRRLHILRVLHRIDRRWRTYRTAQRNPSEPCVANVQLELSRGKRARAQHGRKHRSIENTAVRHGDPSLSIYCVIRKLGVTSRTGASGFVE